MRNFSTLNFDGGRDGAKRARRGTGDGGVPSSGGSGSVNPGKRHRAENPNFRDKLLNHRPGQEDDFADDHGGNDDDGEGLVYDGDGPDDEPRRRMWRDGDDGGGGGGGRGRGGIYSGGSDEDLSSPDDKGGPRPRALQPRHGRGGRVDAQHHQRTERRKKTADLYSDDRNYEDANDDDYEYMSSRVEGGGGIFSGLPNLPSELANDADHIATALDDSPLQHNKKPNKQQMKQRQHGRGGAGGRTNQRAHAPTQTASSAATRRRPAAAAPRAGMDPLARALDIQGRTQAVAGQGRTRAIRGRAGLTSSSDGGHLSDRSRQSSARDAPSGRKRQSYGNGGGYGSRGGRLQRANDPDSRRMTDYWGSSSSIAVRRDSEQVPVSYDGDSLETAASRKRTFGEGDAISVHSSSDDDERKDVEEKAKNKKKQSRSTGCLTDEEVRYLQRNQKAQPGQERLSSDEAVARSDTNSDGKDNVSAFSLTRVPPTPSCGDERIPRKKKASRQGPTLIKPGASIPDCEALQNSTVTGTRRIRSSFVSLQTGPRRIHQTQQPQPPREVIGSIRPSSSSSTPSARTPSRSKSTGVDPAKFYSNKKNTSDDLVDSEEEKPRSTSKKTRVQRDIEGLQGVKKTFKRRTSRRLTRSQTSSQKASQKAAVIMIESSSDEDEGPDNDELDQLVSDEERQIELAKRNSLSEVDSPSRKRKFGSRHPLSVVRIAIGKKVYSSKCTLEFQLGTRRPFLELSYTNNSSEKDSVKLALNDDTITELKYYLVDDKDQSPGEILSTVRGSSLKTDATTEETSMDDQPMSGYTSPTDEANSSSEDQITFIAIRVTPNTYNGLGKFKKSYAQNVGDSSDPSKRYIVIELRSEEQFMELLPKLRSSSDIVSALLDGNRNLSLKEACKYTTALAAEDEKEKKQRLASSPRKTRSMSARGTSAVSSYESDTVLLVYPFVGGDDIERAAVDLKEAKGDFLRQESDSSDDNVAPMSDPTSDNLTIEQVQTETTSGRTHYLTIRGEDRDRLDPMEFLNDTLVDFWMRWIWRKEVPSKSDVYFFSSHFFTTLEKEGAEAVSSWTAKKNVDIFSKRFIFLPINHSLHWSLCVVANPGFIENSIACNPDEFLYDGDEDRDKDLPCIVFLDSLKAHQKQKVAKTVRLWLNFEWHRLGKEIRKDELKEQLGSSPIFTQKYMKVYDPKIPYQNNSWDCGVFVCRYAYGLYQRRNRRITFGDLVGGPLRKGITDSEEFHFGMDDIERMRQEMGILIDNLSAVYLRLKEKEVEERRARKLMKKQKKEAQENSEKAVKQEEACNHEKAEDDTSCTASGSPTNYYV